MANKMQMLGPYRNQSNDFLRKSIDWFLYNSKIDL